MTAPQPTPPRAAIAHRCALAGVLLLALILRAYLIDAKSFWIDEFASVGMACGHVYDHFDLPDDVLISDPPRFLSLQTAKPLHAIWFADTRGHAAPLYPFLLRAWGEIFGLGTVSARVFSLVCSVAAVAVLYLAVRELSGRRAALWVALIAAVAGPQIQFAQEARPYALLVLVGLAAAAALIRIEQRGFNLRRGAALAFFILALALTHYFSIGLLLALAIYALLRLRGQVRPNVILCLLIAGVAWLALGAPGALHQTANVRDMGSTEFLRDAGPGHILRTFARAALLPVRFFTEPLGNSAPIAAIGAAIFLLAPLLAARRRDLTLWSLWLILVIAPILLLDLIRQTKHLEFTRYTLLASPAAYAFVAAAIPSARPRAWLVPLLVVLACALSLPQAYRAWWKADWRALARAVDAAARPGDITLFLASGSFEAYPNSAFLHMSYYRRTPLGPIVILRHAPSAVLLRQLRSAPGVLVIADQGSFFEKLLPGVRCKPLVHEPGAGALGRVIDWPTPASAPAP